VSVLDRLRGRPRPGTVWTGPAAYFDGNGPPEPGLVWPGFYALDVDGKSLRRPVVRLVSVDDAPGDPEDGAWHLEVAGPNDPPHRGGNVVPLEADAIGSASVDAGEGLL